MLESIELEFPDRLAQRTFIATPRPRPIKVVFRSPTLAADTESLENIPWHRDPTIVAGPAVQLLECQTAAAAKGTEICIKDGSAAEDACLWEKNGLDQFPEESLEFHIELKREISKKRELIFRGLWPSRCVRVS